jgi:hypothetical protein
MASRIGECVAMTNCAPPPAARSTIVSSASAPLTDSAASGSSRM